MKRQRTYSRYAIEAAALLGEQIKLGRKQKRWTENELAERAGISRATLQKIEKGDMSCAVGLVFEVATLVNIPLFEQDTYPLSRQVEHIRDKVALLPRRIRTRQKVVDDNFWMDILPIQGFFVRLPGVIHQKGSVRICMNRVIQRGWSVLFQQEITSSIGHLEYLLK